MIHRVKLPSGLRIVCEVDPSSPAVAYHLWVSVGSAYESDREAGLSHYLEHMLFKGTEQYDSVALNNAIEMLGGNVNAYTSFEETAYHMILSSRFWEQGLSLFLDMIFKSTLDEDEMEIERGVILEEMREGENVPDAYLSEKFFEHLFPNHPYGKPVIGNRQSIQEMSHERLIQYYKKWYRPDNMVLAVSGNVDFDQLNRLLQNYFLDLDFEKTESAQLPKPEFPKSTPFLFYPKGDEERVMEVAFALPGMHHTDIPAIDVLNFILGEGDLSRLHQSMQVERNWASSLETSTFMTSLAGVLILRFYPHNECELKILRELAVQIQRIQKGDIKEREIVRAKLLLEKELLFNDEIAEGRARTLAYYESIFGSAEEEEKYLKRIRSVTAQDIASVANKYLNPSRQGVAILLPANDKPISHSLVQEAIQQKENTKQRAKKVAGPPVSVERFSLTNGMRVVYRNIPGAKVGGMFVVSKGGLFSETVKNNGISNLMSATMDRGTSQRTLEEIVEESSALQADIQTSAGRSTSALKLDVPNARFIDALPLSLDLLTSPSFEKGDVEMERKALIREYSTQKDYFEVLASNLFMEKMYPDHPYGMNLIGRPESLKAIGSKELKAHLGAQLKAQSTVIGVVADVSKDKLYKVLESGFENLKNGKKLDLKAHTLAPLKELHEVRKPISGEKGYLWYGFRAVPIGDPQRYAMEVLASALTSSGGGRLFARIREELGLVYSIDAMTFQGIGTGHLVISLNTTADRMDQAYEEVRNELKSILEHGITEEELIRLKNYVIGSYELDLQRHGSQAAAYALGELFGTGKDPLDFSNRVAKVTRKDVLSVARATLTLDRGVLVLLSPNVH